MIAILMATYNGERYIAEQIESLLAQTVQDFVLYINDDCSTDKTYDIVCRYAKDHPKKIMVAQNIQNTGNAKYNFIRMMIEHKEDYLMLCDQDDVWKPDKVAHTFGKIQEMERLYCASTPILVHTDLEVVDEELQIISPSFRKSINISCNRTALNQIVIQNVVTGCTAMYNSALANLISTEPPYLVMHDWWLILIASAFGEIGYINECTIYYRQHEHNSIGAKDVRTLSYKVNRALNYQLLRQGIENTYRQADSFLRVFSDKLSSAQKTLLQQYCAIPAHNKIGRIIHTIRLKTFKSGISRRVAQLLFI